MKIYLAGPLFNIAEKAFNMSLTASLEKMGLEVFLPQRDGVDKSKSPYDKMSIDELNKTLFTIDRDHIFNSDIFLFILDGRVPDEGASVALGLAYSNNYQNNANNKKIIGFHSDTRAAFLGNKLNPMIKVPLDYLVTSERELFELLRKI